MRHPRRYVLLLLSGLAGVTSTWNAGCGGGGSGTPSGPDTASTGAPSWVKVASASLRQGSVSGATATVSYHVGEVIHGEVWVSSYLSVDGRTKVCGNDATGSGRRVLERTDGLVQVDGIVTLSPTTSAGPTSRCGTGPLEGQPVPQSTGYILTHMTEVQPGGGARIIAQEAYPWAQTWW